MLIGGINLNKLNSKEKAIIQNKLAEIYPPSFKTIGLGGGLQGIGSLKKNYDRLKAVAPWVIKSRRYQTWDKKYIHSVTTDLLNYIPVDKIDSTADETDKTHPAYTEPEEMEKDLKGDTKIKDLILKSNDPNKPAKKPSKDLAKAEKKPTVKPAKEPAKEPVAKKPMKEPAKKEAPKTPEIPSPPKPNEKGAGGYTVSKSANDANRINQTNKFTTVGGTTVKKPETPTGNAVIPSGNQATNPKTGEMADPKDASRIKKK